MVKKIISSGRDGAEKGALKAAVECQIPYAGWVPRNPQSNPYYLTEVPTDDFSRCIELNLLDSNGAVVFYCGELDGVSAMILEAAKSHKLPCLHIDPLEHGASAAASILFSWVGRNSIQTLYVSGSSQKNIGYIFDYTRSVLKMVLDFSRPLKR